MKHGKCGYIYSVIIDVAWRGNGLGRVLLSEVEKAARDLGYCYIYLDSSDQVGFYLSCGYVPCRSLERLGGSTGKLTKKQLGNLTAIMASKCADMRKRT